MNRIDCLGDMCPIPILKTRRELKKMKSGEVVKVVTDHSCVLEAVINHFKKYEISHEEVMNGIWEISIRKI